MAEEQLHSSEVLTKIFELMQKKDKEESKDNVRHKPFPVKREDKVKVYVRTSIIRVGNIDAVRQEFHCEFYMRLRWKEPMLRGENISNTAEIPWDPRYYFINAVTIEDHERNRKVVPPERSGEPPQVIINCRIIGTFKEVLNIKYCPFDYQKLSLTLTSTCHDSDLEFVKDRDVEDNICTDYFYPKQEWDLRPHVITEPKILKPKEGASWNKYPQYEIRMNVMRQCSFYVYNVLLIMLIITVMTFAAFAVEADSPGDRIQIALTLLLTSVAFKYYVQQFVPTVSYLTLLDKYILSCMIFQFFMAVYNVISGLLASSVIWSTVEWVCCGISILSFVLINTYFGNLFWDCTIDAKIKMHSDREEYMKRNPTQQGYKRRKEIPGEEPNTYLKSCQEVEKSTVKEIRSK